MLCENKQLKASVCGISTQTFLKTSRPQNVLPKHLNAIGSCELIKTTGSIFCISIGNTYQSRLPAASQTFKNAMVILSPNSHGINVNMDDQNSCEIETVNKMVSLPLCVTKHFPIFNKYFRS